MRYPVAGITTINIIKKMCMAVAARCCHTAPSAWCGGDGETNFHPKNTSARPKTTMPIALCKASDWLYHWSKYVRSTMYQPSPIRPNIDNAITQCKNLLTKP